MNERLKRIIDWFKEHNLADGISASELFEKYNPLTSGGGLSCRSEITQLSRDLIRLYDMGILGRTLEEKVNGVYRYYLLPEKSKPFIIIKQNQVSCSVCGHHYSTRDSYPAWCEICGGCLACCSCCDGEHKEKEVEGLTGEVAVLTGYDEWEILNQLSENESDLFYSYCNSICEYLAPTYKGKGFRFIVFMLDDEKNKHNKKLMGECFDCFIKETKTELPISEEIFCYALQYLNNHRIIKTGEGFIPGQNFGLYKLIKRKEEYAKYFKNNSEENNGGTELSDINFEELSNSLLATARPIFVEMLKKDRAECELQYKKIIEGLQANLIEKDNHLKSEIEAHNAAEIENRKMSIKMREQENKIKELVEGLDRGLKIRTEQNETIIKLEARCKKLEEQKTKIVYEDMRNKMGIKFRDLCEEEIKNNKLVMKCG